jgi:hypothetical protein
MKKDWEKIRAFERSTNLWVNPSASKANTSSQGSSAIHPTITNKSRAKPAFRNDWILNSTNVQRLHRKDETDTAKNLIRQSIQISANPKCDDESRLELAGKIINETRRQTFTKEPALTLDLLKKMITQYSYNKTYLRKDPSLERLASLVIAFVKLEPGLLESFISRPNKTPSRLSQAINKLTDTK